MHKALSTIGFMIIFTVFFISILAFINESTETRIALNLEVETYKSILYAFNILPENFKEENFSPTATTNDIPWNENKIIDKFKNQIQIVNLPITSEQNGLLKKSFLSQRDSTDIYIRLNEEKEIIAYGFKLKGKGLWGTISAFAVITADLENMVGIDFFDQVETPGLGARILESEFKFFFRKLNLVGFQSDADKIPAVILVKQKKTSNVKQSTNSFQSITGATQTVDGVLAMINTDIKFYITLIKQSKLIIEHKIS
jgi:Na+-transporting NADH:ubiquinone oxidoreductase subunit C